MSYCSEIDIISQFNEVEVNQLLDRNRDGLPDDGVLDEALSFADDMIDGYLMERYNVPIINPPRNLVGIAADIARYRLYADQPTDLVIERYNAALLWLRDVARGLVSLLVIEPEESRIAYAKPQQIFTRVSW